MPTDNEDKGLLNGVGSIFKPIELTRQGDQGWRHTPKMVRNQLKTNECYSDRRRGYVARRDLQCCRCR